MGGVAQLERRARKNAGSRVRARGQLRSRNDQATKDLFITNQLAFHVVGPWVDPTYRQAAQDSGLKYDFVLVPGARSDQYAGIKAYEILGVAPGKNADVAWQFAAYIADKPQMLRWAKLLSRYNANAAAMADPEVAKLPLIAKSVEAVKYGLDVKPPYFVGAYLNCYNSIVTDNAAAVADAIFKNPLRELAVIFELSSNARALAGLILAPHSGRLHAAIFIDSEGLPAQREFVARAGSRCPRPPGCRR